MDWQDPCLRSRFQSDIKKNRASYYCYELGIYLTFKPYVLIHFCESKNYIYFKKMNRDGCLMKCLHPVLDAIAKL